MESLLPSLDEIPHLLEEISEIMMNLDAHTTVVPNEKLEKQFHQFRSTFRDNIVQYLTIALPACNDFYQATTLVFEKFEDIDFETWRKNIAEILGTVKTCKEISCHLIDIHEEIDKPLKQRESEMLSLKQLCLEMSLQSENTIQGKDSGSGGFLAEFFGLRDASSKAVRENNERFRHEDLLKCQKAIYSFENEVFSKILSYHQKVLNVTAAANDIAKKLEESQNGSDFVKQTAAQANRDQDKSGNEGDQQPQKMSKTKDEGPKHQSLSDINVPYDLKELFNRVQANTYYAKSSFVKFRAIFPVVKSNVDAILASKFEKDTEIL